MYGSTMNCSWTENDGKFELGYQYKDSNGVDINRNVKSNSYSDLINKTINSFKNDYINQTKKIEEAKKKSEKVEEKQDARDAKIAQLEKKLQELIAENDSLKANNKILQRRADDAVNKTMNKKEEKASSKTEAVDPFEELFNLFF